MSMPRIWPGKALTRLMLVPALLALGLFIDETFQASVIVLDLLVLVVALADLLSLKGSGRLKIARQSGRSCSLEEPQQVVLLVENLSSRTLRLRLRDDVPAEFDVTPAEFELTLPAQSRAELDYVLIPRRRGTYAMDRVDVLASSRMSLWQRHQSLPVCNELRVYPDIRQIARYTMLARRNKARVMGLRTSRSLGTDNEFERLRDYADGDDPRHLDWRSSARRRKLTVRAYQQNQSQRILFLVDCGRMMDGVTASGLTPLDHALNAVLLLSHVALIRGDQVGLLAFADQIRAYVPPGGGPRRIRQLVYAVHNVFPEPVEPRFDKAFLELERRCRKRSLVVLLTNLFDDVTAQLLSDYLGNLHGRHLPLIVTIRDRDLFALADRPIDEAREFFESAAAADLLNWRERVLAGMRRRGMLTLDTFAEELTGDLVSRYLEIKARHLL